MEYMLRKAQGIRDYFTRFEWLLWMTSMALIVISFLLFDHTNYVTLVASLIGVTSLIFAAKGNPLGQLLMIVFSLLYGAISYSFAYYGEMVTYLGMTAPMATFALISWLRNPYEGKKSEVEINEVKAKEYIFLMCLTIVVTVAFYFILKGLHTGNLIPSTISVTTSFAAVYLTFRRCHVYALAYAANDIVLIILWTMASMTDRSYVSVVVCFIIFLANDFYGYVNWSRMKKKQRHEKQINRK